VHWSDYLDFLCISLFRKACFIDIENERIPSTDLFVFCRDTVFFWRLTRCHSSPWYLLSEDVPNRVALEGEILSVCEPFLKLFVRQGSLCLEWRVNKLKDSFFDGI
jgi:hypothetical protein